MLRRKAKNIRNVQRKFQGPHVDSQLEGTDDGQHSEANKAYLLTLRDANKAYLSALGGTPGGPKNATAQSETHKECIKKIPGATYGFSAGKERHWQSRTRTQTPSQALKAVGSLRVNRCNRAS